MKRLTLPVCLALCATLLAACGDDGGSQSLNATNPTNTTTENSNSNIAYAGTVNVGTAPSAGRLLASQCFQCHGTNGRSRTGIDSLAGESAREIIEEMREMKAEAKNDIMHFQARGYTDAEIQLMAAYIATLK